MYVSHAHKIRIIKEVKIKVPITKSSNFHYYTYLAPKFYNNLSENIKKILKNSRHKLKHRKKNNTFKYKK